MKDKKNPPDTHAKAGAELELESDQFSIEEQEDIVRFVKQDIDSDAVSMQEWIEQRKKDIQMYEGERPSVIEDLEKLDWMSDRNMGLCAANCDAYQATLLATVYNINTIHFKATEVNDIDHKEQLADFTKWGLGEKEANFYPEVDDFIHNKVTQGISYFYIYWKVWYEWVDRRIPKYGKVGKLLDRIGFKKYEIKTEHKRFEKGLIENIPDVTDLMFPAYGRTLQEKQHLIHKIHRTAKDILDLGKRNVFVDITEDYVNTLRKYMWDNRLDVLKAEKANQLGIKTEDQLLDNDLRLFPIDLYMWYGKYEKNGRDEEFRFIVEPNTNKFLAGKPLRKVTRSGKRPYVGRPFIRRPGFVRGNSLPHLIEDPVNAFNNTWNQKSDFQYVSNVPFFFYEPTEEFKKQQHKIRPGTGIPSQDPQSVNFPNFNRSLAWADTDFQLCLDVIERLTGAASYFQSRANQSKTLGQDEMIEKNSDTRFGLWVNRILCDVTEAITMWVEMYQDWAPDNLGERILGEDGKKLFPNFSIETIRGGYDAKITPDIISGSRTLEKEIALWSLDRLEQSVWFNPQINPKGNWGLYKYAAEKIGFPNIEKLMPPEPQDQFQNLKLVKDKWTQLSQGQMPEIEEGDDVLELYMGFMELANTKRNDLDPEYKPNLDVFLFRLNKRMIEEAQRMAQEKQANEMAMKLIQDVEEGRMKKKDVFNA